VRVLNAFKGKLGRGLSASQRERGRILKAFCVKLDRLLSGKENKDAVPHNPFFATTSLQEV